MLRCFDNVTHLSLFALSQLRNRGSRIRGAAVSCARSIVSSHMGFKRGAGEAIKASNMSIYKSMKTSSAFHYKVREILYTLKATDASVHFQDPLTMSGFLSR